MNGSSSKLLAVFVALLVCFWMVACASETHEGTEGDGEHAASEASGEHGGSEEGGEQASAEGSEGDGEHASTERSEGEGEHGGAEGEGEHGEGGGHESGEEGEESGVYIGRDETWDATRRGARLVLSFDPDSDAFVGTVENTTGETICAVRVEVHLSGGTELGPTERTDLPAGETMSVELPTGGEAFDTWTAHPESSPCSGS